MNIFVFELTLPTENAAKCLLTFSGNFECSNPVKLQEKFHQRTTKCPLKYFVNLSGQVPCIYSKMLQKKHQEMIMAAQFLSSSS